MMRYKIFFLLCISTAYLIGQTNHWETIVDNGDLWSYYPGLSEPPSNWTDLAFNDNSWESGPGGIGYGDDDDNTIIAPVNSLYLRKKFSIIDKADITRMVLHADYDDAFVAYINGVEVFRNNVGGFPPRFNTGANQNHEAGLYRGISPEAFEIRKEDLENLVTSSENILCIQAHNFDGTNSSDLSTNFFLSVGIESENYNYGPVPNWFFVPPSPTGEFTSNLPILKIDTGGEEIFDEPSIPGTMSIVWNGDLALNSSEGSPNEFEGNISIEKRGQSSLWVFPKNGYAIETKDELGVEDMDVSFLNFPEEEDWVLHGPYSDKTFMRNVLAMHLANSIGGYHSRTRYVELVVNGSYEGIYVLMEKIKQDKNRIDIADLNPEDINGDELTGGYVFKIDKDEVDWFSNYDMLRLNQKIGFQFVSPKASKIVLEQKNYIRSYVDSFETALNAPNLFYAGKRYNEYADINSFIDHLIIKELSKDIDAYRISSYYYKEKDSKGGKIHAGPVWDFNLGFANADYCDAAAAWGWQFDSPTCGETNPFWFKSMYDDLVFRDQLKCKWNTYREGPLSLETIYDFIDEQKALLQEASVRNFNRWPVLGLYIWPNSQVFGSFDEEVEYMKQYIADRIDWMDAQLGACTVSNNELEASKVDIFPNPFIDELSISILSEGKLNVSIELFNPFGQKVLSKDFGELQHGRHQLSLRTPKLAAGIYFCKLNLGDRMITKKLKHF